MVWDAPSRPTPIQIVMRFQTGTTEVTRSEESLKRCDRINSAVSPTGSSSGHLITIDDLVFGSLHLAPPPPPPFYSSFAIPLIRNHRRPLQQWIRDNNQWRRITRQNEHRNSSKRNPSACVAQCVDFSLLGFRVVWDAPSRPTPYGYHRFPSPEVPRVT